MSECAEFVIQSLAFLQYNGYNLFDPHNEDGIYLALKPEFCRLFAGVLCFNTTGSGLLWLLYALLPRYCFGHYFKRSLFLVDRFSDFMYILFPFSLIAYRVENGKSQETYIIDVEMLTNLVKV